ncbi:hemolysin-III related-domain-containing protein [Zychaea mexicana]|uniref:hemolysin-III related-domain-containing protein n=1 Tax=Zychaea mexicana TaxID=64656 RepID=UPI0022FE5B09|nr:hemolysin-III related-domain-containing protein [Zychaea mexicana]KAI9497374.1 hemolysin-III related-domain-containing protein [Zychaea mexicana]
MMMRRHSLYHNQPAVCNKSNSTNTHTAITTATTCLTTPRTRCRSHSTSSLPSSPTIMPELATFSSSSDDSSTINIHDDGDDDESAGFLQYMDDQVHETWDSAKALVVGAERLLRYHELPKEWQENEYVLSGYRFYASSRDCVRSIFMLHNETLNIWSHLIGFIFFSFLSVSVFNHHFPEAPVSDRAIFATFCIAALKCLFCSSIYHTFICHHKIKGFAATLDYIGIALLIAASVLVTEYYGYYCRPVARSRYMVFTGFVSSFGVVLPFFKCWDTKEFRPIRIAVFLSLAFSSIVPVLHLVALYGFWSTWAFLEPAMISVSMYLLGVLFYVNRWPEKKFPGRFDYAGMTSHAIWHVFVCFGIYFHYMASLHFYKNRFTFGCAV